MTKRQIHSDLALETIDSLKEGQHYLRKHHQQGQVKVEVLDILKDYQNHHQGRYIEISFDDYLQQDDIIACFSYYLKSFIDTLLYPTILIVGLGNAYLTNDAIGPRSIRDLKITHYLDDEIKGQHRYYDILALSPGVMYQTGMESVDIIEALVKKENIDMVIVIDALCAKDYQKIGHVIQLNNVGILPGSGVGNHRKAINQETLGIPVIAIGVPTVIYASSLVGDILLIMQDYFADSLNPVSRLKVGKREKYQGTLSLQQREQLLGYIGQLDKDEMMSLLDEILNPIDCNYVLSDKQVDEQCEILSSLIAQTINELKY